MTERNWFWLILGALLGLCLAGVLYAVLRHSEATGGDLVRQLDRIESKLDERSAASLRQVR